MNFLLQNSSVSISAYQLEQFQKLIYKLYQCCQERIQHQSERFNLPDAELRCLRLFGQERYLTSKGISRKMRVVKSRITKIIDGLVSKGFVKRSKDPEDSRVTLLCLTSKGQDKLDRINASILSSNKDILSRMTSEQRNTLLVHLEILKSSMKSVKPD
jgi:DNA-binding MarR family transcriptional regulator